MVLSSLQIPASKPALLFLTQYSICVYFFRKFDQDNFMEGSLMKTRVYQAFLLNLSLIHSQIIINLRRITLTLTPTSPQHQRSAADFKREVLESTRHSLLSVTLGVMSVGWSSPGPGQV